MKRRSLLMLPLLAFVAIGFFVAPAEAKTVRVATFNIENGPDAPGTTDYNATKAIVQRINADIVAFQEVRRTSTNDWLQMAAELGYSNVHLGTTNTAGNLLLGFFSRFPLQATNLSSVAPANEFTRRPMRVVVQVPGAARPLVMWNMHHKADDFSTTNTTPANQFRRAIEAHRIVQDINAYRLANPTHTELVMLGDLNENMFSTNASTIGQLDTSAQAEQFTQTQFTNSLLPIIREETPTYTLGADISFPVLYRTFPDSRYATAGLQRLNLRQQNGTWTGTRGGKQLGSGRYTALDYILVSTNLTNGAKGEIFNAEWDATFPGMSNKFGAPLTNTASISASDHFAVFADIQMQDAPTGLLVSPSGEVRFSGLAGGPFTSTNSTYTVTNVATQAAAFTVSSDRSWLVPQISSGTAPASGATNFSVSINTAAAPPTPGEYTGSITITGPPGTTAAVRTVRLVVLSPVTDYLTQQFTTGAPFNLANRSVTFTPDGSVNFYRATIAPASSFPLDPAGGTVLPTGIVYSSEVSVAEGKSLPLFGTNYSRFFIGSAGYITFLGQDTGVSPSPANHFSAPRISGLFFDLDPRTGTVSYKQTTDRVAVTYQNIPQFRQGGSNSFQIEMFFDGRIRLTWLGVGASAPGGGAQPPLVGLSPGGGLPAQFSPSVFTNYPPTPAESAYDTFVRSYGLDPSGSGARTADPDNDGFNNGAEFLFGGSPLNADAAFLRPDAGASQVTFTFVGREQGAAYSVEKSSDLTAGFVLDGGISPTPSQNQDGVPTGWSRRHFSVQTAGAAFYRIRATEN